jgi:peptidyl-tRNA hydrolase
MFSDSKLFIVTRSDMPAGHQCVQTALALTTFATQHPVSWLRWYLGGRNLVVLSVANADELYDAFYAAETADKTTTLHFENCQDDKHLKAIGPIGFTAFVTGKSACRKVQKIGLALQATD